jgi:hypothetical protein
LAVVLPLIVHRLSSRSPILQAPFYDMGNLNSTLRYLKRDAWERQHNQTVDATVAQIDELRNVLNGAATFLPEAGSLAPLLQSIVRQIRVSRCFQFNILCHFLNSA